MNGIQVRGTYAVSQACIPHMIEREPAILTLSPPIDMAPEHLRSTAYIMAKYAMTICALGIADFARRGYRVDTLSPRLWSRPRLPEPARRQSDRRSRKPEVYSDAAYIIFNKPSKEFTGHELLCEDVLVDNGVTDLSVYSVVPGANLGTGSSSRSPNPPGYTGP